MGCDNLLHGFFFALKLGIFYFILKWLSLLPLSSFSWESILCINEWGIIKGDLIIEKGRKGSFTTQNRASTRPYFTQILQIFANSITCSFCLESWKRKQKETEKKARWNRQIYLIQKKLLGHGNISIS